MLERVVTLKELETVDIWVTPDVIIVRQEGMFFDTEKTYLFAPSRLRGFVVVTSANEKVGCRPLYAYMLMRPAAITLSFVTDKTINFRKLGRRDAVVWQRNARTAFKVITKRTRNTSQTVKNARKRRI